MKIAIDYIAAIGGGGNAVYTRNLIENIAKIDKNNQYLLFCYLHDYLRKKRLPILGENFKIIPSYFSNLNHPIPKKITKLIDNILFRTSINIFKPNIVHITNPLNYRKNTKNFIVTIHDLAVFHNKEWAKIKSWEFFKNNIENIIKRSRKIIAVSEYTKKDIFNQFNINTEKIIVIPEAASKNFYKDYNPEYVKNRFDLIKYIFYVGQLQPRKNIIRMLEAYYKLDEDLKNKYKLAIAGTARTLDYLEEVKNKIKNLGLEKQVCLLGRVNDNDLRKLYSTAEFFVYPSLFEGFGLPILESLSCGTPVVASNTSSLPEVAGNAGLFFNPTDTNDMTNAMKKMFVDKNRYNLLRKNCAEQVQKFNWKNCARDTLNVYREVF